MNAFSIKGEVYYQFNAPQSEIDLIELKKDLEKERVRREIETMYKEITKISLEKIQKIRY